jgi:putative membrane protein
MSQRRKGKFLDDPRHYAAFGVLVILHIVGLVGLNLENYRVDFEGMIWVNLLFILSILLSLHRKWNSNYLTFIAAAFSLGMVLEIIGVKTDQIFGAYSYTDKLGTQLGGVPLIIGANWIIVTYCAGMLASRLSRTLIFQIVIGAFLMLLLDVLIEPFAIKYHLWEWTGGKPALRNWFGWFATSLIMQAGFHYLIPDSYNRVGTWTYFLLIVFFLADLLV